MGAFIGLPFLEERMRFRPRMVTALGMAMLIAGALLSSPSYAVSSAKADPVTPASTPAIGIDFRPVGGSVAGQCTAIQPTQWVDAGTWSRPIRIDADNRAGYCQLAFGVRDTHVGFTYLWVSAGG